MTHHVLARKWRPKKFAEIVEQCHVTQALINALDQQRLHHAYLFTGTRGVGKTTLARLFAKCLNCVEGISSEPCGKCSACQEIDDGRFVDLIEVDAASRTKVEDTRELLDNVKYTPTRGRYKIYLIDEVHMLSGHSFNALLKTLEEPPPHVIFLLATTDPQKLPVTVLSRCLQFNLKSIIPEKITEHLLQILKLENIENEEAALQHLALAANGSIRDALSLLDQAITYSNSKITVAAVNTMLGTIEATHLYSLLQALAAKDAADIMTNIFNISQQSYDFNNVLEELLSLLHHLSIMQVAPKCYQPSWGNQEQLAKFAQLFTPEELQLYYQIALIGRRDLPLAPSSKQGFEMVMLRMLCFNPSEQTITTTAAQKPVSPTANKPTATTIKSAANNIDGQEWHTILPQLELTGSTKALAANCSLRSIQQQHVQLLLHAKHAPMLNSKHEQRLQDALTKLCNQPMKVSVEVIREQMNTPESITQQRLAAKQQQAEVTIAEDTNILALQQAFDATIIPGSIKSEE